MTKRLGQHIARIVLILNPENLHDSKSNCLTNAVVCKGIVLFRKNQMRQSGTGNNALIIAKESSRTVKRNAHHR
jgi:hypothetical protein